ncbi:hypothetical protein Pelo_17655 [Pelomyxa schiedti]|nr:hypothetical protein Pelo_17655 [Pelomyxa schiedti]
MQLVCVPHVALVYCTCGEIGFCIQDKASGQFICNFNFPIPSIRWVTSSPGRRQCARGIAVTVVNNLYHILVGSVTGSVFVFLVTDVQSFQHINTLQDNQTKPESDSQTPCTAISAMAHSNTKKQWVCVDEAGAISLWLGFDPVVSFPPTGNPCTGVTFCTPAILVCVFSGHMRVYNLHAKAKQVEITAHSHCITAVAAHPSLPVVITASEDSFALVWSLANFPTEVRLVETLHYPHCFLTGAQFVSQDCVSLVAYENPELLVSIVKTF